MERLMAGMAAPRQTTEPAAPARMISPEDEEEYGPEFLSVVAKKARDELSADLANFASRFESLEHRVQGVDQVTARTARERMEHDMDTKVPEWRNVNHDPNFLAWLRLPDPYSGATRHMLLKQAFERNETSRVLAFFNGFLSQEAAEAPRGDQPDDVTSQGKVPLDTFVAPGRARTTAATDDAPVEKPIIKSTQISRFYADVAAGKYSGREAEKVRAERAIFEAGREGRIR